MVKGNSSDAATLQTLGFAFEHIFTPALYTERLSDREVFRFYGINLNAAHGGIVACHHRVMQDDGHPLNAVTMHYVYDLQKQHRTTNSTTWQTMIGAVLDKIGRDRSRANFEFPLCERRQQ